VLGRYRSVQIRKEKRYQRGLEERRGRRKGTGWSVRTPGGGGERDVEHSAYERKTDLKGGFRKQNQKPENPRKELDESSR